MTDTRLADEQAALQRVVGLVVRGVAAQELFDAVAAEAAALIEDDATLVRVHEDGTSTVVATCGGPAAVGTPIDEAAGVRVPILVEGTMWGIVGATRTNGRLAAGAEQRLAQFAEIAAAAIASAQTRAKLEELVDEQTALGEVAELVARGAASQQVLTAVATAASKLLNDQAMTLARFDGERELVVAAAHGAPAPVGTRIAFEPETLPDWVRRYGEPVRVDDYRRERDAALAAQFGLVAAVAAPIALEGEVWGMFTVTSDSQPLPDGTEHRLQQFAKLVAAALANSHARAELQALADEQSALRRVATLVAREASQAELFSAIAEEIRQLLGTEGIRMVRYEDRTAVLAGNSGIFKDSAPIGSGQPLGGENVATRVFRTGEPARIDDYGGADGPIGESLRPIGIRSIVATPIVVEGRLWGAMGTATTRHEPLPPETESRLGQFTELMATAIGNAESHDRARRLIEEQAALRRVATLVADGVPSKELFDAVSEEVGRLVGADLSGIARYEDDNAITILPPWAPSGKQVDAAGRVSLEGATLPRIILETGRPAREDQWDDVAGPVAELTRDQLGIRSAVGSPIVVGGRVWGGLFVSSTQDAHMPGDTESRLVNFTELVATAMANADARAHVERLADEQAALRRVATLVAQDVAASELLQAVAHEVGTLLGADFAAISRFEDATVGTVATWAAVGEHPPVPDRVEMKAGHPATAAAEARKPVRWNDWTRVPGRIAAFMRDVLGVRSTVACPIMVKGRVWGTINIHSKHASPLPPDTESRISQFTDLIATAIANADARAEVERLVEEQAALRRVATLVAEGALPTAVFDAVAAEMEGLLDAHQVALCRYEPGTEITVVAHRGPDTWLLPPDSRLSHEGESVTAMVQRTERPARMKYFEEGHGAIAEVMRAMGLHVTVGAPIVVDGRLWGVITASWRGEETPPYTEERMVQFAQLLDAAIANADGRDQLTASRARLLAAADEARRHVVRDLHDGAQQRLVHTVISLKLAQRALREPDGMAESLLGEALEHAEQGTAELRELAHGILPAALTRGGLRAGIDALVTRLDLPVHVDVESERFPAEIEASAYFIVAEALTNVVKHSQATRAEVNAAVEGTVLCIEIRDDGIGGADADGHGLVGMGDRVTALGGRLTIESPAGGGTLVVAALPFSAS